MSSTKVKMKLKYSVYVLQEGEQGTGLDGPVQAVRAPLEETEHDEEIGSRMVPILDRILAAFDVARKGGCKPNSAGEGVCIVCVS